jgi:hypothetical protein
MTTKLDEDEVTILIQLLNQHLVAAMKNDIDTSTSLESRLITRLASEREALILSQLSKGLLP